jgi:hypothetical protein
MTPKPKTDSDKWYVCVETASITTGPEPYDFTTVHEGDRRRGDDPLLTHAAQFFLPEDMTPEQRTAIVAERRRAETEAMRAADYKREQDARREAAERAEQERVEAKRRQVVVYPPYEPEMANPLHERGVHPFTHLAGAISQAMGKGQDAA